MRSGHMSVGRIVFMLVFLLLSFRASCGLVEADVRSYALAPVKNGLNINSPNSRGLQVQSPDDFFPQALEILESDEDHILIELTFSQAEYFSDLRYPVVHHDVVYDRLRMPLRGVGARDCMSRVKPIRWAYWGQSGQPELPMLSLPLGMPILGTPQVSVVDFDKQTVPNILLYPVPVLTLAGADEDEGRIAETFTLDAVIYSTDTFYPGPLAEAAVGGLMRDQPVFQLRLYPFQYNPLQQALHIYRRLRVLVTFPKAPHTSEDESSAQPAAFEHILAGTLLNYDRISSASSSQPYRSSLAADIPSKPSDDGSQVKLRIEDAGLYRVTYEDLVEVAPDLVQEDPRNLVLSNQGMTIPILFDGNTDGTFDAGDSFLFYAQSIQSVYTRYNVYWLQASDTPGMRMTTRDGAPGSGGEVLATFRDLRHYEEDTIHWRMPNGGDTDHWFWDKLSVSGADPVSVLYTFDLHHVALDGPAGELRFMLYGYTTGDHRIQLYLNNVPC